MAQKQLFTFTFNDQRLLLALFAIMQVDGHNYFLDFFEKDDLFDWIFFLNDLNVAKLNMIYPFLYNELILL